MELPSQLSREVLRLESVSQILAAKGIKAFPQLLTASRSQSERR